jgi:hypothetical protein
MDVFNERHTNCRLECYERTPVRVGRTIASPYDFEYAAGGVLHAAT